MELLSWKILAHPAHDITWWEEFARQRLHKPWESQTFYFYNVGYMHGKQKNERETLVVRELNTPHD